MVSSSNEYVTELLSSFERQISRNSAVHISGPKVGFYKKAYFKNCYPKMI